MSIYSGFATRQLEQSYNQLLNLLILSLTKRLVKFYKNEECNEIQFKHTIQKSLGGMKSLEMNKYLEPKFSETLKPLEQVLNIQKDQTSHNQLILKNVFSQASDMNAKIITRNEQSTPQSMMNINKSRKRTHSISLTKRKELEFRQQLLQFEEQQMPTNYFIRQSKKF